MCGRYMLDTDAADITSEFDLSNALPLEFKPRYNIAPGTDVLIVRSSDRRPTAAKVRWGLVPFWAKDAKMGKRLINARAETVSEKPAFRRAFEKRRCLLPANGYYEWRIKNGGKQPFLIYRNDARCFAIAGLWERWRRDGKIIESCAVVTCPATGQIRGIHDRMPLLVGRPDYDLWLNEPVGAEKILEVSKSPLAIEMTMHAVSTFVNSPANDSPDCIAAIQSR